MAIYLFSTLELLHQAILKTKDSPHISISKDPLKGSKRKQSEEVEKRGRKKNKQRIAEIGRRLIESGQFPMIKASFT